MYLNKNKHVLSKAIMLTALIRIMGAVIEGVARMILRRDTDLTPAMMDGALWKVQVAIAVLRIMLICIVFRTSYKVIKHYEKVVDDDDKSAMRVLQEEYLGEKLSTMTIDKTGVLLQIWGVILIGAEIVYFVSSMIYRRFNSLLTLLLLGNGEYESYMSYISLYNLSHGFKYLEMLTAILLGVTMTAIFLKDQKLKLVVLIVALAFLLSFGVFEMNTMDIMGRQVGIVWTSIIFHLTETVGLFGFAIYLSKKYKGL